MADQPVEIVAYDPAWGDRFREQEARVAAVLAPWMTGPVEHVGSTAVRGLPAKPVVDMLAPVLSRAEADDAVDVLTAEGWLFWPDDPNRAWRLWFLRPRPEARTHHLHVIQHDHAEARAMLAFRDALCADPGLRTRYAELKTQLAERHRNDRDAYTEAKGRFVTDTLNHLGPP